MLIAGSGEGVGSEPPHCGKACTILTLKLCNRERSSAGEIMTESPKGEGTVGPSMGDRPRRGNAPTVIANGGAVEALIVGSTARRLEGGAGGGRGAQEAAGAAKAVVACKSEGACTAQDGCRKEGA